MNTGIELIAKERQKQLDKNRSIELDVASNFQKQLTVCAQALLHTNCKDEDDIEVQVELTEDSLYDWDINFFRELMYRPYKERLVIAGALIAAELDRLNNT